MPRPRSMREPGCTMVRAKPPWRGRTCASSTIDDQPGGLYGTMDDFNLAVELLPQSPLPHLRRGQLLLAKQQDREGTLADVNLALLIDPSNMPALKMRARLLQALMIRTRPIAAFTDLINALEGSAEADGASDLYDAYSTRAGLYAEQGLTEEAIADYTSAIELAPSNHLISRGTARPGIAVRGAGKAI